MKWTLKLEHIDDAGILQSTMVGFIESSELTSEADLGLTYDDGKYLIRQAQSEIASDQVRALMGKARPCSCGGRLCAIKDHRRRRIDTVFGQLHIHAPLFKACACGAANVAAHVAVLFPHRATPGRGPATRLTVLSDGEDVMRFMAGQWLNGQIEHRLDWFHLHRRIERLGICIRWMIDYSDPDDRARLNQHRRMPCSVRHRTLNPGKRLDKKARDRAWFNPPETNGREQIELDLPNDPERECCQHGHRARRGRL